MLKSRLLFSSLLLSLLSPLIPSAVNAATILDWNPSLSELPPAEYDALFFAADQPDTWNWNASFSNGIKDIFVAAPIHPIPYKPVTEYNGNHDNFGVSLDFFSPGVYTAKIDFVDNSVEDKIQFFYVGSSLSTTECPTCNKPQHSRVGAIVEHPSVDLIILESPETDNGYIQNAAEILDGEKRASSVDEAINLIKEAFTNKGNKPVSVKIVAHGNENVVSIGSGTTLKPGKFLFDNDASVNKFINELKGKVSSLTFKSCCVAKGVDKPGRDHLMERLADGLGASVSAWDQEIAAVPKTTLLGITIRDGYFALDVHGKKGSIQPVPEPTSTFSLLALGTLGAASTLKRKLNTSKSAEKETEKVG
jgi:hypothetical protein